MVRLLVRALLNLIANAVGLIVASLVLDGFSINSVSFVVATLIFTCATVVLGPLITKIALRDLPVLMGGVALVTTLVGLILTTVLSDGLSISGLSTWIVATLIVWLSTVLAGIILPMFLFKQILAQNKD